MTLPEEKPQPEEEPILPENPEGQEPAHLDPAVDDVDATLSATEPAPDEEISIEADPLAADDAIEDNATFPLEEEEPVDLSEIFAAREFKPNFDIDAELEALSVENPTPVTDTASRSARRRRPRRLFLPRPSMDEIDDHLESMARRAAPTIDLFVFALLAGVFIGIGYMFNAAAALFFGVLVSPLLAPWAGAVLSAATGETRFFGQTLGGFFSALLLVFATGALAGFASRVLPPIPTDQALLHARFWPMDILLLIGGSIVFLVAFIQNESKPMRASLVLAYELFLPISAAGFGLGSGVDGLWPEALLVFLVHLALALFVGLAVFFYMGFRPVEPSGYLLSVGAVLISLALIATIAGIGTIVSNRPIAQPALVAEASPTATISIETLFAPTDTALPTGTATPTPTGPATATPVTPTATVMLTPTITPLPTLAYGRISSPGDGAVIRFEPGGAAITTIENGYLVEIQPDAPVTLENAVWIHVIVKTSSQTLDGWVLLSLVATVTPEPVGTP